MITPINSFNPEWYKPKKETKINSYDVIMIEKITRTMRIKARNYSEAEAKALTCDGD